MKTLILTQPGEFTLKQTSPDNQRTEQEALVRVHRIGICGTDMHAFRGKQPFFTYPRILGHELGVEVVEVAADNPYGIKVGDKCSVEPYLYCGECSACRRGSTNCCIHLKVLGVHTDGGMREYIKVPVKNLHSSRVLSLEQLALVETLGIGAHAVQRAHIQPNDTVLVIGAGPIGLAVITFVKLTGARLLVMDLNEDRLAFCHTQMGVQHTITGDDTAKESITAVLDGELPHIVFDATGNPASMMNAFALTGHAGKLVFVGLFQGDFSFHDPDFHRKELSILASRNAQSADFKRIINYMEKGEIDTTSWITHRTSLEEMIAIFPSWLLPESRVVKAMVNL